MTIDPKNADAIRRQVFESCAIAVDENGYDELLTMDPYQLAIDLTWKDSSLDHLQPEDVLAAAKAWQQSRAEGSAT